MYCFYFPINFYFPNYSYSTHCLVFTLHFLYSVFMIIRFRLLPTSACSGCLCSCAIVGLHIDTMLMLLTGRQWWREFLRYCNILACSIRNGLINRIGYFLITASLCRLFCSPFMRKVEGICWRVEEGEGMEDRLREGEMMEKGEMMERDEEVVVWAL